MLTGSVLVVVADGGVARFLRRARPGAALVELIDHRMEIGAIELERDRPPVTYDRFGEGRHKIEHRLTAHEAAEEAFLSRAVVQAVEMLHADRDAGFVLVAPPRALGIMRRALPADVRERLLLSVDKDVTKETPQAIDVRLREERV